jgi:cell division protein FtsQ
MILILLALSVSFAWISLKNGKIFPISIVKVEANYAHLTPAELQQTIVRDLPASYWTVDLQALATQIQSLPWVESVNIEKIWPGTLKIRIHEKHVLVRWGEKGLLSDKNEVFHPGKICAEMHGNLPILYGPEGKIQLIVKQYDTITRLLQTKQLSIQTLLLSESGAWFLRIKNGPMLLLGTDKPVEKLKRFLRVYKVVFENENHVARRVDLRYSRGMAVLWADPVELENK